MHEVPRDAVLVHAAVLGQAVGDLDRALEAQAAGAQLDGGGDLLAGAVGEVVQAADRRRRGVAGPQDDVLAVDVDRQLALEDLEALGEREVAVQRVAAAGRDLELDQRALAAALLARLEEGRAVALGRVVEAARLDGGGGCGLERAATIADMAPLPDRERFAAASNALAREPRVSATAIQRSARRATSA
jgi:hypothetical protein